MGVHLIYEQKRVYVVIKLKLKKKSVVLLPTFIEFPSANPYLQNRDTVKDRACLFLIAGEFIHFSTPFTS